MALVDLEFEQSLNVSLQIGDSAYYVDTSAVYTSSQSSASGVSGGVQVSQNSTNPEFIGIIEAISNARNLSPYTSANPAPSITIDTLLPASAFHNQTAFIFFSKDNKANLSSILGYYADIQFKNDSKQYAEVYSVGVDTFNSSK